MITDQEIQQLLDKTKGSLRGKQEALFQLDREGKLTTDQLVRFLKSLKYQ